MSCSEWNELPLFLLEPSNDRGKKVGFCEQCSSIIYAGDEEFLDINNPEELFCSIDCCIDYYQREFVVSGLARCYFDAGA